MADNDKALIKAQQRADEALELANKFKSQLKEARASASPTGMHRKAIAAGAGVVLGIAEAGKVGSLFGRDVTVAHLLPAVDFLVEKVTDGKPPGGLAGDVVRVLGQAGDVQVADGARELTRTGIGLLRAYLGMNRPAAGPSPRSAGPAAHPSPEPATVVDETGRPVTS